MKVGASRRGDVGFHPVTRRAAFEVFEALSCRKQGLGFSSPKLESTGPIFALIEHCQLIQAAFSTSDFHFELFLLKRIAQLVMYYLTLEILLSVVKEQYLPSISDYLTPFN